MAEIMGKCQSCDGTGIYLAGGEGSACPKCTGTGRAFFADVSIEDVNAKLDSILEYCAWIKEKLDKLG